jgi:hypothetical protein
MKPVTSVRNVTYVKYNIDTRNCKSNAIDAEARVLDGNFIFSISWRAFISYSLHVVSSIHMPPFYYWPIISISFGNTYPSSKFVEDIGELLQKL